MRARPVLSLLIALPSFLSSAYAADGLASIGGRVYGPGGPIPGARVFLETGLDGPITTVETDAQGAYTFENVIPTLVGVFAHSPGLAIDGRGVDVAIDDAVTDLDIRLSKPGVLTGTVVDEDAHPVAGARVTRAVILGASRVGIPFAKLSRFGIDEPTTNEQGRFTIASLPQNATLGLKIAHPSFAQGVVGDAVVGGRDVGITLSPGILLAGTVLARGRDLPVGNARLEFRSALPPNDTVVTYSRGDGGYAIRLRPGPWLFQASGIGFRSATGQRIELDAAFPSQSMPLHVSGTSTIRGFVKDAKSGEPITDARVLLTSNGIPAATTTTGPTGAYEFTAIEGDNVVRLGLAPGFLLPPEPAIRVTAVAGEAADLPTFWVAPLPRYSLEVVDAAEEDVPGAIVRVLEPSQFGWYQTDADGLVELSFASLPADGTVVGFVEHPTRPEGALFAITRDRSDDAIVQLQPLVALSGRVTNEKDSGVSGAIVEASTRLDEIERTVTLWRTISGSGGTWSWPAATPHVPVACIATATDDTGAASGQSDIVTILPVSTEPVETEELVIPEARSTKTGLGRKYEWHKFTQLCGEAAANGATKPTVVAHVTPAEYGAFAESLSRIHDILRPLGVDVVLVTDGDVACAEETVVTFRGTRPSIGTVYVTDSRSNVVYEGFDLPPMATLLAVSSPGDR
jgi:hypothetical protein